MHAAEDPKTTIEQDCAVRSSARTVGRSVPGAAHVAPTPATKEPAQGALLVDWIEMSRDKLPFRHDAGRPVTATALVLALVMACASSAQPALSMESTDWSVVAQRDLDAASNAILESHPAALDGSDTAFHAWMKSGLSEANVLASQADSPERADAAVRYFLAGFSDGHLVAWRPTPYSSKPQWAGWTVQPSGRNFVVVDRANDWDGVVPPLGAVLTSCDGSDVLSVLTQRVSPFVDRRIALEGSLSTLSALLSNVVPSAPLWDAPVVRECEFHHGDRAQRIRLHWRESGEGLRSIRPTVPEQAVRAWGAGRYWVHATDFSPRGSKEDGLQRVLQQLRDISDAEVVVLDLRGNGGGDSGVGIRMLRALLKGAAPSIRSEATAHWRISPLAIASLESLLQSEREMGGVKSAKYRYLDFTVQSMQAAANRGETFVQQDASAIDNDDSETGTPFKGKLILVTDNRCASACLDVAEMALDIPGAAHVGQTTSADTPYLEVVTFALPSGLQMWIPTKVWRHLARGSNVPIRPAFPFPGHMTDTARLRDWIDRVVLPRTPRVGR